jgi:hypothetical protein
VFENHGVCLAWVWDILLLNFVATLLVEALSVLWWTAIQFCFLPLLSPEDHTTLAGTFNSHYRLHCSICIVERLFGIQEYIFGHLRSSLVLSTAVHGLFSGFSFRWEGYKKECVSGVRRAFT